MKCAEPPSEFELKSAASITFLRNPEAAHSSSGVYRCARLALALGSAFASAFAFAAAAFGEAFAEAFAAAFVAGRAIWGDASC